MTLCAIGSKKKKKKKRKLLPALKGLTAPSYDQVPNPLCSTSVHLFMNLSLALFLTGRTRTVFFSSVSKKKRELWFFANSWRETICFNGAGSVIFMLTKGRFSALHDPRNRSCYCSSDVLMGFTGLWRWGQLEPPCAKQVPALGPTPEQRHSKLRLSSTSSAGRLVFTILFPDWKELQQQNPLEQA